jgi:hypothetical protein
MGEVHNNDNKNTDKFENILVRHLAHIWNYSVYLFLHSKKQYAKI